MAGLSTILDVACTAALVSRRVRWAGVYYRAGELLTEEPAMSHVVGQLRFSGHQLPIGPGGSLVRVTGRLAVLHRATKNKADLYGSDLAVRIVGPLPMESKTAFIQMKMHDKRKHLYACPAAVNVPWIDSRRFVASIGRTAFDTFVVSVADLSSKITAKKRKGTNRRSGMLDLGTDFAPCDLQSWVKAWLSCTSGPKDGTDAKVIESVFRTVLSDRVIPRELRDEFNTPAKVKRLPAIWIEYSLESEAVKGSYQA